MDPRTLSAIVSLLGIAAFVSWLLQLAAAGISARPSGRPAIRRVAGSRAWPATAHTALVSWLTALGIEIALVGVTERTAGLGTIWFILALSFAVGRQIDRLRGQAER